MKNILLFTLFQLKILWENRRTATILWLSPIFFLLIFVLIGKGTLEEDSRVSSFQIAIVNEDDTVETKLVIQQLTENEEMNKLMTTLQVDKRHAQSLMEKNELAAIIYIPKDFSKDVAKGINTPVKVVGNKQRPLQAQLVRHVLESAANYTSAAQSGINTVNDFMKKIGIENPERIKEIKRTIVSFSLHVLGRNEMFLESKQNHIFQQSLLQYYAISFYVLLLMIWSFIGQMIFNKEIKYPIMTRLKSMGVTAYQISVSTCLSSFFLVLISALILILPLFYWQEQLFDQHKTGFIGGIFIISFMYSAVFTCLQAILKNERMYQAVGMLCILFGTILGGHFIPVIYYPEWLEKISYYSLNTWVFEFFLVLLEKTSTYPLQLYIYGFLIISIVGIFMIKTTNVFHSRKGV